MRLWHKDLVDVLPKLQMLSQWRELNSIYKNLNNHILINFIYEYPNTIDDLYSYSELITDEFEKRGYKHNDKNLNDFFFYGENPKLYPCKISNIYPKKMNERYLKQCLYNLQEKFDCGGITEEEWRKIHDKFSDYIDY